MTTMMDPHSHRQKRRPVSLLLISLAALSAVGGGCAPRVYPPAAVSKPATIYLCDYGVHSSLLLPTGERKFVEYVYGDWAYAVENQTDPLHTFGALLVSFNPALGRRFLTTEPGEARPHPPNIPFTIDPIIVEADRVAEVVRSMDERYQRHIDTAVLNDLPTYRFTFVRDDEHYSFLHSCNHLTETNLERMGCVVGGFPIGSNFVVYPPGGPFPLKPGPFKMGRASPQ